MGSAFFSRLLLTLSFLALICISSIAQEVSISSEVTQTLPGRVGEFRAQGSTQLPIDTPPVKPNDFYITSVFNREYVAPGGNKFSVSLVNTNSSPAAYSLLRYFGGEGKPVPSRFRFIEGLGIVADGNLQVGFIKGASVVTVSSMSAQSDASEKVLEFSRQLAQSLQGDIGATPVLIQHLPDWEKFDDHRIGYAVSLPVLKSLVRSTEQPVLDTLSFEGGTEAAIARYDQAQLVIVEFTTPQYAQENDTRIAERITQLKSEGQPVPTLYRREGNYSVFVFDAPDEATAAALVDQVKYEKEIRWLGDNPNVFAQAEKFYQRTMTGVVLAALKVTGIAILVCLGIGGIFGGAVFLYRRSRPGAREVYSDAGGMLQLNIEDVNSRASKLIGDGER